jgi:23S rRNA pseudouridine1911/1915/1917 synthase
MTASVPLEKLFSVIHEDDELLVINKPAGLVCHPTKTDEYSSLISRVRLYLGKSLPEPERGSLSRSNLTNPHAQIPSHVGATSPSPIGWERAGVRAGVHRNDNPAHLVNRLDRETSGVTLVAKRDDAAREIRRLWENRLVEKEYAAIVHGHVRDESGLIDAPLGKDESSRVAVKDCVRADGLPSQTEYFVEKRFSRAQGDFTLLRIRLLTGRKHQIRIHLAHIGHPIVGDKLYGGDEDLYLALVENRLTDEQRQRLIFRNHALHARMVRFTWRSQTREFHCEPEPWFQDFLPSLATKF